MLRGLLGGLLTSLSCAVLSAFVVWRGMSFMGEAISHSVLPGIVLSYVLGINLFWGALAASLLVVVGISLISSYGLVGEQTAIGVVFVGFFAFGILLLSKVASASDLSHILFGNVLGVSKEDLIIMGLVASVVIAGISLSYKEVLTASFDPAHAAAIGLSPHLVRNIILVLLALTTVSAIQTVGVVLVLALLITPGAAASQISRRPGRIILFSVVIASFAIVVGFYVSYYANLASGPSIVIVLTIIFVLSAIGSRIRRGRIA
ncbi:Manganese ABC transporter, inner membrane permease protein SitD [Olavius algarvensis spirochete endosymbiont]|uniref:metal ABC transporter permease n=1 Tax=Olavius algarvensis spirochete endosymbiont TaxID=260710 RepID=UPI000F192DE9|nr:metal ABC transporter permease [Olavius algarvensis spirochete endosymbiont]VDB00858.1 Manganese ABC transporter, inner membrane permease protein SitD [Olavius algarvensis spirochete endosymbiont]